MPIDPILGLLRNADIPAIRISTLPRPLARDPISIPPSSATASLSNLIAMANGIRPIAALRKEPLFFDIIAETPARDPIRMRTAPRPLARSPRGILARRSTELVSMAIAAANTTKPAAAPIIPASPPAEIVFWNKAIIPKSWPTMTVIAVRALARPAASTLAS